MKNKGFTLIELLIVIAILATLAVVVLLALDPVQQLARTRDSGRSSTVTQLGHALESYGTVRNGAYPVSGVGCAVAANWITNCLVNSGEIKVTPSAIAYSIAGTAACAGGVSQNNICYIADADSFAIYMTAEAKSNLSRCASGTAHFVYASGAGRGGIMCAAPGANEDGTNFLP
jgi:prepilin-type N-terminal cleavage/methylation domain-containing protein